MKLKTKLSLGLSFLFTVILVFGVLGIFYINLLSNDAAKVLKNNHESLVYCNNMLKALENIAHYETAKSDFNENLKKQEANITEPGELEATKGVRQNYTELLAAPDDSSNYPQIRMGLQIINDLNQNAILKKNNIVQKTADDAKLWLTIIFTVLFLITLTFIVNFPAILSNPITKLTEGIVEIAGKNYSKRIYLKQKDEFGELANAFNSMAEKLDQYERSNLAQLRFEKSRIETIINQMNDGIIGFDAKKRILFLNVVAEKLLGVKEAEVMGKYSADVAVHNDLMRTLLQDGVKKELKIYADNKESYFNKDVLNVMNSEEVIGQVIVLKNITPFHELNEAKTNFIATVSHELKTPISSIKMSAQLLSDNRVGNLNEEQNELIKSITDDSERLLKITSELLNMSQVETGNIQLKLQPVAASAIVQQAVEAVLFKAQQKQVTIKINADDNLPMVNADQEKTAWVLINFLTNAIKFSPEHAAVEINTTRKNNLVEFTVRDTGKGIEEKYLPKIFDRYFKVPGSSKTGTGLGLAISKEFIEAQGGSIRVQSEIGTGSSFSFLLNIAG
ncbi:MAG: HAMP domain-containing protein [Chitinophagaceae bacterium]|nr:HAMP domain-containing protein [Chitinophagaceae bacterium]MBK8785117.1 HAMP domain-containing protein [Chitinophagaceae bacterium]MBL0199387.1 HAMP domain-containing protein [Chitinophagaceae bacterium]